VASPGDFVLSPDGRLVATRLTGPGYRLQVRDAATGAPVGKPLGHVNLVLTMAFSPDSRLLATGGHVHDLNLWDAASGKGVWDRPPKQSDMIMHVAFSPDGRSIAVACYDGLVHVLDVSSGRPFFPPLPHSGQAVRVTFSPDGRRLVTQDLSAGHLWDLSGGRRVGAPMPYPPTSEDRRGDVQARFSPDGKVLLLSSGYGSFRLWDGDTAEPLGPQTPVRKAQASSFAFSPDGRLVLSGHDDGTARVWEVEGTRPVGAPVVQAAPVRGVAFRPDGRSFRTFGADGCLRTWPLPSPLEGEPGRIKRALELMTGLAMDASGNVTPLDRPAWENRRRAWLEREGPAEWRLLAPVDDAEWHDARAADAEAVGAPYTARHHLDQLIALRPDDWMLHARRGRTHTDEENWADAGADYQRALRLGGSEALRDWFRYRAWVCQARGQAAAARWYEEYVSRLAGG
jgi:WD40 repeat protein